MTAPAGYRMTTATLLVLRALLDAEGERMYGFQLVKQTGLASGVVHPLLHRLAERGWLADHWEDLAEVKDGRPRRRYYRLTETGAERARAALDRKREVLAALDTHGPGRRA